MPITDESRLRELPRWLVRHVCHPENHKLLGKQPRTWVASSRSDWKPFGGTMQHDNRDHTRGFVPIDNRLPVHYRGVSKVTDFANATNTLPRRMGTDLIAHLDNNDYRLWSEVRQLDAASGSRLIMARCRWCQALFPLPRFAEIIRKRHKELCNFTHNLRAVYDILRLRGKCLICARDTKVELWGLPICSEDCKLAWKFSDKTPGQMAIAMHKARFEGKLKESLPGGPDAQTPRPTIH